MAISTSISCTSIKSNNENQSICNHSDMQILIAEKLFKLGNENDPIVTQRFTADPAVLVYKDTVYVYGTNDSQQLDFTKGKKSNTYEKITSLNCFSSTDLVNWTDCGIIHVAGKNEGKGPAKWASNSWAPAVCWKNIDGKDKFFLYFADSGNGIGVLTADSPTGPFTDPLGHALISRSTPNTKGVHWLFDPAVFVDDDGKGYIYYGGGVQDDIAHPKSARCTALGEDMISLSSTPVEIDAPFLFEDSGINKINGKYIYSYCTNWSDRTGIDDPAMNPIAVIAYMSSDNPLGPFTYQGYTLENPGKYFGPWGNNHHWMFEFKNKLYIAYHTQTIEKNLNLEETGYRCVFINEMKVNDDGSLPIQKVTKEGVLQTCKFNPNKKTPAATFHSTRNIVVSENLSVTPIKNNAWIQIQGVDFSQEPSTITFTSNNQKSKGTINVVLENFASDKVLATVEINGKGDFSAPLSFTDADTFSTAQNLFFVFSGNVEISEWECK